MLKLLKLYINDYSKKLIITFILSIIAGIVLFYPLAEDITEQIIFMNWVLYIAMYGVFFYHFPLTKIVKWSVNLPLKKRDLILFNIIYQLFKIVSTFGLILFAFWVELILFKDNLYVGQINDNISIISEYIVNRDMIALKKGFLPSMKLMILILSISFFFTFIFNVAPYGPFKNKLITFRDSVNFILFKLKTFKKKDLLILITAIIVLVSIPYFYSKAFIAGFFVTAMLCVLYFTYEKALIFSKATRFYSISFALFIGLYTWLGLVNHSKRILHRPNLSLMDKIEEWEFLNLNHFGAHPVRQLALYLSDSSLCDQDIRKIFFYFRKKHYIAVNSIFKFPNSFENIILSKGKCGLKSISKTIDPKMMTSDMLILYFNKWNEVNITYSPTSYERIIKPFLATPLKLNDAKKLILSGNEMAQYFILRKLKKSPALLPLKDLEQLSNKFSNAGALAYQDFLKKELCLSVDLKEIQTKDLTLKNQCRKMRNISSVLEGIPTP